MDISKRTILITTIIFSTFLVYCKTQKNNVIDTAGFPKPFKKLYPEKSLGIIFKRYNSEKNIKEIQNLVFKSKYGDREVIATILIKRPDKFRVKAVNAMGVLFFDIIKNRNKTKYNTAIKHLKFKNFVKQSRINIEKVYFHPELEQSKTPSRIITKQYNFILEYTRKKSVIKYRFDKKYLILLSKTQINKDKKINKTTYSNYIYSKGIFIPKLRRYSHYKYNYSVIAETKKIYYNPKISDKLFQF